jgi:hypothetical protein
LAKPTAKALTTEDTKEHKGTAKRKTKYKNQQKLQLYLRAEKSEGSRWDGSIKGKELGQEEYEE